MPDALYIEPGWNLLIIRLTKWVWYSHFPSKRWIHTSHTKLIITPCKSSVFRLLLRLSVRECASVLPGSLHSATEEHKLHLVLSEAQPNVFSSITWSDFSELCIQLLLSRIIYPSDFLTAVFLFFFEAGVSADVRYSHHPAAAAKTADAGTSSLQHCDCQSGLSQTCSEGSASCSDRKPFLQPYRSSSKEGFGRQRWCYF